MRPGTTLAAYGLVLAAVLGGGAVVGAAAGPVDVGGGATHDAGHEEGRTTTAGTARLPAGGLLVAEDGYRLEPDDRLADRGQFAFRVVGPDGDAVLDYEELHERELHLVVASRDLSSYLHLHPTRDAAGRWSVDLPDLPAGPHRAFADFRPVGGRQYTLGVDLVAPGPVDAPERLAPRSTDTVDGFTVTLERAADGGELSVTVRRDGAVVDTEPYLGASGHLVAIRDGDLAYLHVHPLDRAADGPARFDVEVPSAGRYAVFFDFQVVGVVRTAVFVVAVAPLRGADGH